MFQDEYTDIAYYARAKAEFLKNNVIGYFIAAMLAGLFVGFGVLISYTVGGLLSGLPYAKIVMGASFTAALSLVVMAGSELFTGVNLVCTAGYMKRSITMLDAVKILGVCYVGNWVGSIMLATFFHFSGLNSGYTAKYIIEASFVKTSIAPVELIIRGVLCNMLVCLATWCTARCKTESGKLTMFFWCIYTFVIVGFEHSVANMSLLTISLFSADGISFSGYFYNIFLATFGNMLGGIFFIGMPYYIISKRVKSRISSHKTVHLVRAKKTE